MFSMTWLLTSDLSEGRSLEEVGGIFNRVAIASMLGGTFGAALAGLLGSTLGPHPLLIIGSMLMFLTAAVTASAHKAFPMEKQRTVLKGQRKFPPPVWEVFKSRYARLLLAIAVTGAFAAVMIDFQFYANAAASGRVSEENAGYFAGVYFVVNGGALVFQLLFGTKLQRYVGLAGALMILPLVLFGGSTALVFSGAYVMSTGLRVAEGGLRSSVHRSNWERAFIGIARPKRPITKVVIDGLSANMAAGLGALLLYLWLRFIVGDADLSGHDTTWISISIVVSTVLWLLVTFRLHRAMKQCKSEWLPFMPCPLPECCPTTATLGGAVFAKEA